jgi:DNA polymerase-3 subunit alpha
MQYTKQEYLKTPKEMTKLFADVPQAIANTMEIADKVEEYKLNSEPLMPDFGLPEGFTNEDDYLKHITYEGAKMRWGDNLTPQIQERIDFELDTIKKMGFPGYFLIVWDFIKAARQMGVIVGPGRGSAAGSAVAYAIQITNIDPIKYDLLFERFLNPDRISMPDIDIDFDDDGRQQVLDWVVDKYGANRVAHIVTFGTMASKMALKDIARVHKMPLPEADRYAKLIPDDAKSLTQAFDKVPELKEAYNSNNPLVSSTLRFAEKLEGSVRQTGVHACGIIIGKEDLMNNIPVCTAKDVDLRITQYDGKFVESVGMLKMDFLGLKTLSIIKEALENIERSKGIIIDIDQVALDDPKTFELYSRGETTALFQFESPGMKKHLKALRPNRFEDLVAMNALYRPGPMQYIPSFIKRKHGEEKIVYDHPMMQDFLADTYGITVYQEQVMLLSRALANFTRGQSDSLRKAMGKKQIKVMNELKLLFVAGCKSNPEFMKGIGSDITKTERLTEKIWSDWEAFASYAFNKSHSVCYAYVSYQTAYIKAHYPAEFMASVMSRNLSDIKKITVFMDETRRMGLNILGPDVNESFTKFTVNKQGAIRFGIAAIKGVGDAAVMDIIKERAENGEFKDIYDFVERVNLRTVNKKTIESLALAGAFDSMQGISREQLFKEDTNGQSFIETLLKYGNSFRQDQSQTGNSLFGGGGDSSIDIKKPIPEPAEPWGTLERLNKEKELVGIYISAHPLDDYRIVLQQFANKQLSDFENMQSLENLEVKIGGIVTEVEHKTTKAGKPFGSITLEDYSSSYKISFFGKDYGTFRDFMFVGTSLYISGRVQKKSWGDTNELEYRIAKIEYLSDLKDKIKSLSIKIPIEKLDSTMITEIKHMVESNKGNAELRFLIYEPATNTWVQMHSKAYRINITTDVLNFLEEQSETLVYKLG